MTALPMKLVPIRTGDEFLILIPNYWAKGPTMDEALYTLRKASGRSIPDIRKNWSIYSVHPKTYCEEVHGALMTPKGARPPILVATTAELSDEFEQPEWKA